MTPTLRALQDAAVKYKRALTAWRAAKHGTGEFGSARETMLASEWALNNAAGEYAASIEASRRKVTPKRRPSRFPGFTAEWKRKLEKMFPVKPKRTPKARGRKK